MTCKELAEILMETPDLPVSFFTLNSVGCNDVKIGKEKLWCNGKQEEYRTIRINYFINRFDDKTTFKK